MTFLFERVYSACSTLFSRIWPSRALKRRFSEDEEENDDIVVNYQSQNKRPKWMTSAYHSNFVMSSPGKRSDPSSSRDRITSKSSSKKHSHPRINSEVKENAADIEIIEVDTNNHLSMEGRPPLSNLAIRPKSKTHSSDVTYVGSTSRTAQNNYVQERRQNGVQPSLLHNSFTTPQRLSKPSSMTKQTALNETFKLNDRRMYSELLAEYHKSTRSLNMGQDLPLSRSSSWTLPTSTPKSPKKSKSVAIIDLTGDDSKPKLPQGHISVTPWQGAVPKRKDTDVKILEERQAVTRVNSLEKQLAKSTWLSPEWIVDMQLRYAEKEREKTRLLEEAKLRKELYAQHNHTKRLEALDERIRRHLKITDVVLDDTEEPSLPELTPEMEKKINASLKPSPPSEVLVEGFGQSITRHDMQTLNKLNWLNDEVINFYMNLLIERSKEDKYINVYAFNTFFYPKLISQGYASLRRWTKKVDIFDKQMLIVPIHLGMHWCMATIDFRDQTVRYYDSMGSQNNRCLTALLRYLNEESLDKKKTQYDTSDWKCENVKDIPQQMNGSDCGMFSCMFAEFLSRNAKITFSQKDMPYFRKKMVYEIVTKKLLL